MNKNNKTDLFKAFTIECSVVKFPDEYIIDGKNKLKYGITSDLSNENIESKYSEILELYSPYIYLTKNEYEVITKLNKIEKNSNQKEDRHRCNYLIDENYYNSDYSNFFSVEPVDVVGLLDKKLKEERLKKAIGTLNETQRRRVYKHYYEGKTLTEIAREENVSRNSIVESIEYAIKKLKKNYDKF